LVTLLGDDRVLDRWDRGDGRDGELDRRRFGAAVRAVETESEGNPLAGGEGIGRVGQVGVSKEGLVREPGDVAALGGPLGIGARREKLG
jgi:hypothetical protein